jgi:hypothetical protein
MRVGRFLHVFVSVLILVFACSILFAQTIPVLSVVFDRKQNPFASNTIVIKDGKSLIKKGCASAYGLIRHISR